MSCENLKFLYTECIKKIHSQEYNPKVVDECFNLWDNLIKCVNTDIIIISKNDRDPIGHTSRNHDLLFENK
jgi:hypothetical protein